MNTYSILISFALLTALPGCLFSTEYAVLEKESPGEIMFKSVDSMRQASIINKYDSFQRIAIADLDTNEVLLSKLSHRGLSTGNTSASAYLVNISEYRNQNERMRMQLKQFDKGTMTWDNFKSAFSNELNIHNKKLKRFYMLNKV